MATSHKKQPPNAADEAAAASKAAADDAAADEAAVAGQERVYPWTCKATNNTPIPLYLSEANVLLAANFHAPSNEAVVTYRNADQFAREMANVDAIASVHRLSNPLILSELDKAAE